MKTQKISIILPVYQEYYILQDVENIETEFKKRGLNWEVICVTDSDLKKPDLKLKLLEIPHVKVLFYPLKRFGKGFGFCYGFQKSKGELIFFWEGNFSISPKLLLLYIDLMDLMETDIVIGSKRHPLSYVYYSRFRRLASTLYQLLVKILFGLNITDTQVGLKLYRRKVLKRVIPKIIIKNWAFDLEVLVVANSFGFKRVVEAPVEIRKHFTGKKLTVTNISNLLTDTLAIFYRKHLLKYYQQKFD